MGNFWHGWVSNPPTPVPRRLFPEDNSGDAVVSLIPQLLGVSLGLRTAPPRVLSSFSPVQRQSQKSLLQDLHSLQLLPQELEQNTEYEFQVRSKPASSYQGTWSDWSPLASLKTTHKGEPPCPPLPSMPSTSQPGWWGKPAVQARPPDLKPFSSVSKGSLASPGLPSYLLSPEKPVYEERRTCPTPTSWPPAWLPELSSAGSFLRQLFKIGGPN